MVRTQWSGSVASTIKFYDTTVAPNKEEFLHEYGRDDSSRALIQFYFAKRNKGKKMLVIPASISLGLETLIAVAAISASNSKSPSTSNQPNRDAPPIGFFMFFILCPIVPFLIMGGRMLYKYSPKKLLAQLDNYYAGKAIPKWISKSRLFKKFLQYDTK